MGRANTANRNANRRDLENLEATPGYTSTGEGMFSRQSATPGGKGMVESRGDRREWSRLDYQIEKEVSELHRHQRRAAEAKDPAEIQLCMERIGKVKRFIDRLCAERRGQR